VDWEWAHAGNPIEDLAWCEWIVRMHHPRDVTALGALGILTEDGALQDTSPGTPQGSILSPLLSNVALSVLDEHIARAPGGPASSEWQRAVRRRQGLPNFRLVRYADDCAPRTQLEVVM